MLAGFLYTNGIIDEDVRDRAQLTDNTVLKRNQILLNAVEQAIKTEPQNFHKFLDILADERATELLYSRLLECYSELYYSVWEGQKHSLWLYICESNAVMQSLWSIEISGFLWKKN